MGWPAELRYAVQIKQAGDCWEWTGKPNSQGRAHFTANGNPNTLVYRWAYEYHIAEIPKGLTLDHLCENKICVNPYHMDPVPIGVNNFRRRLKACRRGHPRSERSKYGCKPCHLINQNAYLSRVKGETDH